MSAAKSIRREIITKQGTSHDLKMQVFNTQA